MVMALTSQGFARAPTATRSALAPRGAWTLDAMTMAFVRSELIDDAVDGIGDDEDEDERSATEAGRGSDTRRRYAIGAHGG